MNRTLTRGQIAVLVAAILPMIGAGAGGAIGTYANARTEFGRAETALGIVASGEGVVLVLALVLVGLTMLGQPAPAAVRVGLWVAPVAAAAVGYALADNATERVVYAVTPMAMSAAAEGLGLLARRIVVYRTGTDTETQRRNAATMRALAYHRARAAKHPSRPVRWWSERAAWRLARRVGTGDAQLGLQLIDVQRERLHDGADAALHDMLALPPAAAPALQPTVQPQPAAVPDAADCAPAWSAVQPQGDFERAAAEAVTVTQPVQPQPPAPSVQPQPAAAPDAADCAPAAAEPTAAATVQPPAAAVDVTALADADADAQLLAAAADLNADALATTGRPASLRRLQSELGIGQRRAQRIQSHLARPA